MTISYPRPDGTALVRIAPAQEETLVLTGAR